MKEGERGREDGWQKVCEKWRERRNGETWAQGLFFNQTQGSVCKTRSCKQHKQMLIGLTNVDQLINLLLQSIQENNILQHCWISAYMRKFSMQLGCETYSIFVQVQHIRRYNEAKIKSHLAQFKQGTRYKNHYTKLACDF